nr:hypothetical protein [Burkholderia gladioli]
MTPPDLRVEHGLAVPAARAAGKLDRRAAVLRGVVVIGRHPLAEGAGGGVEQRLIVVVDGDADHPVDHAELPVAVAAIAVAAGDVGQVLGAQHGAEGLGVAGRPAAIGVADDLGGGRPDLGGPGRLQRRVGAAMAALQIARIEVHDRHGVLRVGAVARQVPHQRLRVGRRHVALLGLAAVIVRGHRIARDITAVERAGNPVGPGGPAAALHLVEGIDEQLVVRGDLLFHVVEARLRDEDAGVLETRRLRVAAGRAERQHRQRAACHHRDLESSLHVISWVAIDMDCRSTGLRLP